MPGQNVVPSDSKIEAIERRIDKDIANRIGISGRGISFLNAGEVMEFAKMMATADKAVPSYLRGNPGACLAIVDDAIRYEMSPFALARKSYLVNDNVVAYEAQVIAAIVITRAPILERPTVDFMGEGPNRQCVVTATFQGGAVRSYTSPPVSQIHPKNSPLWKSDPDQQLAYYSLRAFARRHCPDVIMGIYDLEEATVMRATDVTPKLADRLKEKGNVQGEGFRASNVTDATTQPEDSQGSTSDSDPGKAPVEEAMAAVGAKSDAGSSADPAMSDDEEAMLDQLAAAVTAARTKNELAGVVDEFNGVITNSSDAAQDEADAIIASWVSKGGINGT